MALFPKSANYVPVFVCACVLENTFYREHILYLKIYLPVFVCACACVCACVRVCVLSLSRARALSLSLHLYHVVIAFMMICLLN